MAKSLRTSEVKEGFASDLSYDDLKLGYSEEYRDWVGNVRTAATAIPKIELCLKLEYA